MKYLVLFISLAVAFLAQPALANDEGILLEGCVSSGQQNYYYGLSRSAISCKDLKSLKDGLQIVNMAILPATVALRTPGVRESLSLELAALGLSFANPAVLTITVVGAVGVASLYFVVKRKADDCAKEDRELLKRQLLDEIERRHGLYSPANVDLRVIAN